MIQLLKSRQPAGTTVKEWAETINKVATRPISPQLLYAYLTDRRVVTGHGAKALCQYFHSIGDTEAVAAITEEITGVPYRAV